MLDIEHKTVAELVTENYKTADVFKKNGIDFCCGGKVSVKDICTKKNLSYDKIKSELELIDQTVDSDIDFKSWDLDKLTDYIVDKHHKYVTENIPIISQYSDKVAKVHGHANPEVVQINYLFKIIADELDKHMCKEENILFPYIKNLAQVEKEAIEFTLPHFGTVQNPINMMEHEHDQVGNYGFKIAELSDNYTPPEHACNTYRVLYAKLKEFEEDLHQHIHLENNILFPRAIEIEKKYLNS
ncbi:MAG: iron-sulfur cluster repair di-iron protein [Crocinitomicaceae bacterium]|nr:iron-sulfur cluster repair di-iron protein [Crocinitomicaceae bacterium]